MLQNGPFPAKISFDPARNGPSKAWVTGTPACRYSHAGMPVLNRHVVQAYGTIYYVVCRYLPGCRYLQVSTHFPSFLLFSVFFNLQDYLGEILNVGNFADFTRFAKCLLYSSEHRNITISDLLSGVIVFVNDIFVRFKFQFECRTSIQNIAIFVTQSTRLVQIS